MSNKKSTVKVVAIVVSTILHVAGIYYLGGMALDYALPEGTVDSMEMSFDANGQQTDTTEIAVMDSAPQVPAVPQTPTVTPAPVAEQAPIAVPTTTLPSKVAPPEMKAQDATANVATQEQSPVVIPPSEPVPEIAKEDIPEDLIKDTFENDKTKEVPNSDPLADTPAPLEPTTPTNLNTEAAVQAPVATPEQTAKPYGNTPGVQSYTALTPMAGNAGLKVPTMARLRGMQGLTVVHFTVSADGLVTDVKVVQSSGYSLLDDEASETIKKWKFKPTGEVGVYERPIRFRLSGDAKEAPPQLRRTK